MRRSTRWTRTSSQKDSFCGSQRSPRGQREEFKVTFLESQFQTIDEFKRRFRLVRTIGEGGQAHVMEAVDQLTGASVAVKIFSKKNMKFSEIL